MNDEAEAALLAAGLPAERIHIERFGIPADGGPSREALDTPREGDAADARDHDHSRRRAQRDRFPRSPGQHPRRRRRRRSRRAVLVQVGRLLHVPRRLLEGEVRMARNFALEKHEVAAGFVLTCQAHPLTERVVLSFDER